MNLENLRKALSEVVDSVYIQEETDTLLIAPANEAEVASVLAIASELGIGVFPEGSKSQSQLGNAATKKGISLSLSRMNQVLEYSAADLTVTVQAGTSLTHLQSILKESGQWLPLDPVVPETSTVGGLVATNASGPRRVLYGSLRDQVIGLRIAYPDGTLIKSGGKVVKNVAGYDMNKLFIGSLGTLGVVTEVTLKLRPLPKYQELVLIEVQSGEACKQLQRSILNSELLTSSLELLSPLLSNALFGNEVYTIVVGCDEGEAASLYQRGRLMQLAEGLTTKVLTGEEVNSFWNQYQSYLVEQKALNPSLKVSILPAQITDYITYVEVQSRKFGIKWMVTAGLGTGIFQLILPDIVAETSDLIAFIQILRNQAESQKGALVIESAPVTVKKELCAWGTPPNGFFLMKGIKEKIDPKFILNSGRFLGGL